MKLILLIAILSTCALAAVAIVVALYRHKHKVRTFESLVGKRGEVVAPLTPDGTIRIEGELWPARSVDEALVPKSAVVDVVGSEDYVLLVRPFEPKNTIHSTRPNS